MLWLGFGLEFGKDCYPYFSGGWLGGWVVGGIGTKAKLKFLLRALQNQGQFQNQHGQGSLKMLLTFNVGGPEVEKIA